MTYQVGSSNATSAHRTDARKQGVQFICKLDSFGLFSSAVSNKSDGRIAFTIDTVLRTTAFMTMHDPSENKLFNCYKSGLNISIKNVLNGVTVTKGYIKAFIIPELAIMIEVNGHFLQYLTLRKHSLRDEYVFTNIHKNAIAALSTGRSFWTSAKWDTSVEPGYNGRLMSLIMLIMIKWDLQRRKR